MGFIPDFPLYKGYKSSPLSPPKEQMPVTYLDHLTGSSNVILSLKKKIKLNKHLETFNYANYEREQTSDSSTGTISVC